MKKLIKLPLLTLFSLFIFQCSTDDSPTEVQQEVAPAKVIGTWELYRDENLEAVLDEWTGTEWTTVDQWFQNTREDSQIILEFRADGTFVDRYADVETANGVWEVLEDGRYTFNYAPDGNTDRQETRYITIHCDNTYSIEIEENDRRIDYYRIIDTIECSDLITYNVE